MKLLRHSSFNLLGLGLPLLVAAYTIPVLIEGLGTARFGLLAMVWAVVSYFGLFDLGLGRALTQRLAVLLAEGKHDQLRPLIGTATALLAGLGAVAGGVMYLLSSWAVSQIRGIPDVYEAERAVYAMALAMPAVVITSGFRGVLEAKQAFGIINIIRVPMGLFTFLAPLAIVLIGEPRVDHIAFVLAVGRILGCLIHWLFVNRSVGLQGTRKRFDSLHIKPLCTSGGWLTVSNIASPLMSYADRFLIGSLVSVAAVAYYVTPHEIISKLWIIPGALTAVLFPAFAAQISQKNKLATDTYFKVLWWLFIIMLPLTLAVALFAQLLLGIWITPDFAAHSAPLLQIFAFGIFATCLANIPFTLIQSAGKAKTTALIHCVELPIYLLCLWLFTYHYGLKGAALAWLFRVLIDAIIMFLAARPLLPATDGEGVAAYTVIVAVAFSLASFAGVLLKTDEHRLGWLVGVVVVLLFIATFRRRAFYRTR